MFLFFFSLVKMGFHRNEMFSLKGEKESEWTVSCSRGWTPEHSTSSCLLKCSCKPHPHINLCTSEWGETPRLLLMHHRGIKDIRGNKMLKGRKFKKEGRGGSVKVELKTMWSYGRKTSWGQRKSWIINLVCPVPLSPRRKTQLFIGVQQPAGTLSLDH